MINISSILEGRKRTSMSGASLLSHEIADYARRLQKKLPESVNKVLYLLQKYNIGSREEVETIRDARVTDLAELSTKYNITSQSVKELQTGIKALGSSINLLPMFMTDTQRREIEDGKLAMDDLTMDLTTERGRQAVVKQYAPLVYKIVGQFIGKENLDKAELISAGMEGLTFAMNNYRKPTPKSEIDNEEEREEVEEARTSSFKSYAAYMIRFKILEDIYANSRTIRMSYNDRKNAKSRGETTYLTQSIDKNADGEDNNIDHNDALSTTDTKRPEEESRWKELFAALEKEFPKRDILVFLKYFGLDGEKQEKGKDIAKEFNLTPAMVTYIVTKKIIPFMKKDPGMMDILSELIDMYSESLICNCQYKSAQEIHEMFLADDVYLMLEEVNKWRNKEAFNIAYENAKEQTQGHSIDTLCSKSNEEIEESFRTNAKLIKEFLSTLYPTESFTRKSDMYVVERFEEVATIYKNFNK